MPISYKNKIYTTLGTPTVASGNGAFVTNSAGVPAKDYTVKGKTIVWNQMLESPDFSNTTVDARTHVSFRVQQSASPYESFLVEELQKPGLVSAIFTITASGDCRIKHNGSVNDIDFCYFTSVKNHKYYICFNFTSTNPTVVGGITYNKAQLFDLTQMFGSGNEPTTVAQFRAMFPDDYYPYNAGELKSIAPTSVEASGIERFQLLDKSKYLATTTINGVTFINNGDGTITVNSINITANTYQRIAPAISAKKDHKYCIPETVSGGGYFYIIVHNEKGVTVREFSHGIYESPADNYRFLPYISAYLNSPQSGKTHKPQLFDLTQMFGAGNEPATVAEFWQRVPEKLYGYNPNDYKSANIPSSKYFPDGMKSAGSVYDEINFLSQKAIKRIGVVDLGALDWTYEGNAGGRYFRTSGISDIKKVSTASEIPGLLNVIYTAFAQANWYLNKPCMFKISGNTPSFCISDPNYTDAAAFKAAMSGVMLYYELATPVEIAISPPLQALSTFKGFTSFSAPNSLTQNGPLSVTYYAEGGANPEKGWLTSYKRKLYMGRNIEWNQLLDKSKYPATQTIGGVTFTNNGDGTITANGTATANADFRLADNTYKILANHKCLITGGINSNVMVRFSGDPDGVWVDKGGGVITNQTVDTIAYNFSARVNSGTTVSNLTFKPQLFDLTQMFGAGNEPSTPEEFWSYFDHKLYPYNPGETQPLFKISRKSQGGGVYT